MNENSLTGSKPDVNVNATERIISAIAGGYLLSSALHKSGNRLLKGTAGIFLLYRAVTGNCPGYSTFGKKRLPDPVRNINVRNATIVNRPRSEVYAFWRDLGNLPLFMKHLQSVEDTGGGYSHWVADIPGVPGTISWDAVIVKEEEDSLLAWNSLPGATIDNAGKVEFFDLGEGLTEVHTVISYRAPLGPAGEALGRIFTPMFEELIQDELQQFRQYIELVG